MEVKVQVKETKMTMSPTHLNVRVELVIQGTHGALDLGSEVVALTIKYPKDQLLRELTRDTSATTT